MPFSQFSFWTCRRILSSNTHSSTIFFGTHIFWHHLARTALHLESNGLFPFFWEDYELDQDFELSSNFFKLAFQFMPNPSTSGPFSIVFEHLRDYFHPKDFANGFPLLFQLCSHIAQGHISCWIVDILGAARFLTMTKPLNGVRPIVVGENLYKLISHNLCLQFHDAFATHFSLRQFGIATKGGYETIIHGIRCTLDLDLDLDLD
jgi:hypothetical protein